jgi:formate-dependent nitrite reductase membrane component NrfD
MIWGTWMANSLLLMMILLNFLIAILCASFEDVQNKAVQYEYKAKAEMNVDTMLI